MPRVILHSDANAFYASVELLYKPELARFPVAVCGDPAARHGIVLAKNELAKAFGVKTAEPIWQAKQKCPKLVTVKPHYDLYVCFSRRLREIYAQHTDRIEAFGLDENWLDVGGRHVTIEDGRRVAESIRLQVKEELGITVSIGVSFNKVFAKLGSDYKKPDAVTVFSEDNYREKVWPLPIQELLYVGPATTRKLNEMGVYTIGDLARMEMGLVQGKLGKNGAMLKSCAMGLDLSPVMAQDAESAVKSIGNSTTPPHDIETMEDAKRIFYLLADSVGSRLRESRLRAGCVSVSARSSSDLQFSGCQRTIKPATALSGDIAQVAIELFAERYQGFLPMRSVGLSCSALVPDDAPVQTDLFGQDVRQEKQHNLEFALDELRMRFGHQIVRRGVILADPSVAAINPRADESAQTVAFVMGNRGTQVLR